jgi:hypothetical protein
MEIFRHRCRVLELFPGGEHFVDALQLGRSASSQSPVVGVQVAINYGSQPTEHTSVLACFTSNGPGTSELARPFCQEGQAFMSLRVIPIVAVQCIPDVWNSPSG